ncbi:MAG: DNA/RNA nuclease SfsA [Symbiopectobacterium sp.]
MNCYYTEAKSVAFHRFFPDTGTQYGHKTPARINARGRKQRTCSAVLFYSTAPWGHPRGCASPAQHINARFAELFCKVWQKGVEIFCDATILCLNDIMLMCPLPLTVMRSIKIGRCFCLFLIIGYDSEVPSISSGL